MKNFEIRQNNRVVFTSELKWLIPWFEFEDYLKLHPVDTSTCEVYDKIVGKAAALLMIRCKIGSVHAGVMSELAQGALEQSSVPYTFDTMVSRIDCQTEEILKDINDSDEAYQILCKRAKRC
jgi:hypothetical protein